MENEDINKAIAYLADKVSKYHERLLAMERDVERHLSLKPETVNPEYGHEDNFQDPSKSHE